MRAEDAAFEPSLNLRNVDQDLLFYNSFVLLVCPFRLDVFFYLPCCCFWPWSRAAWSFDRECTRCQARLRTAPGSAISDTRDYGSDAYYISVLLSYFNYVYYAQRYGAEVFENKKLAELALDDTASSASESSSEEETPNASSSSSSGSSDNEGLDEKEIAEKKEKRRKKRKGWSAPARCTAHPRTNAHAHAHAHAY